MFTYSVCLQLNLRLKAVDKERFVNSLCVGESVCTGICLIIVCMFGNWILQLYC